MYQNAQEVFFKPLIAHGCKYCIGQGKSHD
jgi:hypothetical protein